MKLLQGDTSAHDIDMLSLRCKRCLSDLEYLARKKRVPCLTQMRVRNERRLIRQQYIEREKDAKVRDYAQLIRMAREYVDTMNAKYGEGNWQWPMM